jgi:hypothetical protein
MVSHKFYKIEETILFEHKKKFSELIKNYSAFYQKKKALSSQKYGLGIRDLGSEIRDVGSGIRKKQTPDLGVKKSILIYSRQRWKWKGTEE